MNSISHDIIREYYRLAQLYGIMIFVFIEIEIIFSTIVYKI